MATNLTKRTFMIRNDQVITDYISAAAPLATDSSVWCAQSDQRFNSSNVIQDQWYVFYTYATSVNDTLFLTWLTTYLLTHSTFQYRMFSQTVSYG